MVFFIGRIPSNHAYTYNYYLYLYYLYLHLKSQAFILKLLL